MQSTEAVWYFSMQAATLQEKESMMAKVQVQSVEKYVQQIDARQHRLAADEGEKLGGSDSGPNPYELLLSGLGACTSITLRMYAERKGWDLGEIQVGLHFYRDDAGKEYIDRTLTCSGQLSDEQRQRLLEIAAKTPVTNTVRQGTPIATDWK
ncbi:MULTISPECIES: OsmC family protein [unclassified Alcanivorax]|jgi:putative redox protein|uniref:OsmC family protein n=2 Tax=unclassified Alcanivorax TaxID=2638842 RepID=UPI001E47027D|nr:MULTISPECIES: OsmC family protein [unclassified Alcanivorax]|tara:strand:+ start:259 stop:714 length:456 start_codon:yes stop_codon:yes gene_type:complete